MRKCLGLMLASGLALTPSAVAEPELYANGGISTYSVDDAGLTAFTARGGISFHDLLGAELEASFGLGAEELDADASSQIELETQFGGYLVGRYPVLPNLDAFGRVGYVTGEFQTSNNGVSSDIDADSFAFGFGGEYMITSQFGLRGDYTRMSLDDDQVDDGVNVFTLSGVYKFGSVR